jgi:hypothetical protein
MFAHSKTLAAALGLAVAAGLSGASPAFAQADDGIEVGTLVCDVSGGLGLILGSQREMVCVLEAVDGFTDHYVGVINRFGLDIGATTAGTIVWTVIAPTQDMYATGALAGSYVGASAEATVGVGIGANVLVGGGDRSFTLQPISVQGQTGLNIAAGVAELVLQPAPR